MPNARGKNKGRHRRRTPKKSMGVHGGGGKVRLTETEKLLINGPRGFRPIGTVRHQ